MRSRRASCRPMEFRGFLHLVGEARGEGAERGHLLALHDPRLRVLQVLEGAPLRLAVTGGFDAQGDLMADRLQEEEVLVVEPLARARPHVEHAAAPPLELQGDAGVGHRSREALEEVRHARALGRVVGLHPPARLEDLLTEAGLQALPRDLLQVAWRKPAGRGQVELAIGLVAQEDPAGAQAQAGQEIVEGGLEQAGDVGSPVQMRGDVGQDGDLGPERIRLGSGGRGGGSVCHAGEPLERRVQASWLAGRAQRKPCSIPRKPCGQIPQSPSLWRGLVQLFSGHGSCSVDFMTDPPSAGRMPPASLSSLFQRERASDRGGLRPDGQPGRYRMLGAAPSKPSRSSTIACSAGSEGREEYVFPLFEIKAGSATELTRTLVLGHREIENGLERLGSCLREHRLDDVPACVRSAAPCPRGARRAGRPALLSPPRPPPHQRRASGPHGRRRR